MLHFNNSALNRWVMNHNCRVMNSLYWLKGRGAMKIWIYGGSSSNLICIFDHFNLPLALIFHCKPEGFVVEPVCWVYGKMYERVYLFNRMKISADCLVILCLLSDLKVLSNTKLNEIKLIIETFFLINNVFFFILLKIKCLSC